MVTKTGLRSGPCHREGQGTSKGNPAKAKSRHHDRERSMSPVRRTGFAAGRLPGDP